MGKKMISLLLIGLTVFIVSGCGLSEEEVIESISETFQTSFNRQSLEPNTEFDHLSIYFPEDHTIIEESEGNLIFEDQDNTYILFYNRLEPPTSDAFYLAEKRRGNYMLLESYQDAERLIYVKISEVEEDFELQVGVGGLRLTTHVSLKELEDTFNRMVDMINSIEVEEIEE